MRMRPRRARAWISLIFMLIPAMIIAAAFAAPKSADPVQSATYDYSATFFNINSQEDFDAFVNAFSSTSRTFLGKTIYLNCDVDMTGYGSLLNAFYGTFYGNGHAVNNITRPFFGNEIEQAGRVYDLVLNKANITTAEAFVTFINRGIISNVRVTGSLAYHTTGGLVYTNYGTITDCYNYASLDTSAKIDSAGAGGIAFDNYGTIRDSHFLGNITVNNTISALGAIAAKNRSATESGNTVYSLIEKSSGGGEIKILSSSNPDYDDVIPVNAGALAGINNGRIYNSYFVGYYQTYSSMTAALAGDYSANTHETPFDNVYMITQSEKLVFDGTSFTEPVDDISDYIDFDGDNAGLYATEWAPYPVLRLFEGEGTPSSPFLVKDVFGLYNLRALFSNEDVGYTVNFAEDIECRNFNISISLTGFDFAAVVDGRGFALKHFQGEKIFAENQEDILYNTGFYRSPNAVISGTLFSETSGYTYGFGGMYAEIAAQTPAQGAGTEQDPYIITSKEELKSIDGSNAYFRLGKSIVVNRTADGNRHYLNISEFNGHLDGNGFAVVGLFEPLVEDNQGTIINLVVKGYAPTGTMALVAYENNGIIQNVDVYCSIGAVESFAGVAVANNGTIGKARVNGNDAEPALVAGIAVDNAATVENCFVEMDNTAVFAVNNSGVILTSIGKDDNYIAVDENTPVDMEYFALVSAGFDVENVFGYEVNIALNYPVLREKGARYKTSSEFLYDKSRTFVYTYSDTKTYTKSQFHSLIVESTQNMTINWTYNGSAFPDASFADAGVYTVTFNYLGSALYLPSRYTQTITINKQTQVVPPEFEEGAYGNITAQYSGNNLEISTPVPVNLTECGYVYTFTLTKGGETVANARDAGTYTQTLTGTSVNYTNVTAVRTITITKAPVTVTVGNLSINYLENPDLSLAGVTLAGLKESDASLPVSALIAEGTTPLFSSTYTVGSNVGSYPINYSAQFRNYTINQVVAGTLAVNTIDLAQGGITFEDKTVTYSGADVSIVAENLPSGANVAYDRNAYKNVGIYTVTASISKANYNDLVLTAVLTITKASVVISAADLTLDYNPARTEISQGAFGYVANGLVGSDVGKQAEIFSTLGFNYAVKQDGQAVTVFDAGSYEIVLTVTGELDNYEIEVNNARLDIRPISMYSLYASHDNYNATYNGEEKTHPITFFDIYGTGVTYEYYLNGEQAESCVNAGVYTVYALAEKISDNYLDTLYTYTITIAKGNIGIWFEIAEFSTYYDKTDKSSSEYYPYSGTVPEGLTAVYAVKKAGLAVNEAINAGTYEISWEVAESANYKTKKITATLNILPKQISISVQPSYTYSGNNINPFLTAINGAIDNEVTGSNFTFRYFGTDMVEQARITRVGAYIVRAAVTNPNYTLAVTDFPITVNKLTVSVDLRYLEFDYGFVGDINYNGIDYAVYSGGTIVRKNYYIAATGATVDVSYPLGRDDAGLYTVSTLYGGENYTFIISPDSSLDNNNKVRIRPAHLLVEWKFGSSDISEMTKTLTYAGIDQTGFFGYTITGFVNNHKQSDFTFELRETNARVLYNAGTYELTVALLNEPNYVLDNAALNVIIQKAVLNVKMEDVTVMQGEQFTRRSYQMLNPVGNDANIADIFGLSGANLTVVTNYSPTSQAGAVFDYYYQGTFTNYELYITRVGKVTVIENTKRDFTFTDAVYAYDGTYKSLRVAESQQVIDAANVTLTYSENNLQRDAGTYDITLTVTYHVDGTQKTTTRRLTILPSYPRLELERAKTVYRENLPLTAGMIRGKAFVGDGQIAGTFVFAQNYTLLTGVNTYRVSFIPADTNNLLAQTADYTIEAVVLNANVFSYSDLTRITYTESGIEITGAVTMTLNSDIIEGMTLIINGSPTDSIVLNKTETIVVGIMYEGQTVYEQNFEVTLLSGPDVVPVVADERCFELTGLRIKDNKLLVSGGGGRISLLPQYADKYVLFINGNRILTNYPISGDEGSLVVVIKDGKTWAELFAAEYRIAEDTGDGDDTAKKDLTWLIVTGSVAGGVGAFVGLFFVIRKVVRDKRIGFDPYDR